MQPKGEVIDCSSGGSDGSHGWRFVLLTPEKCCGTFSLILELMWGFLALGKPDFLYLMGFDVGFKLCHMIWCGQILAC